VLYREINFQLKVYSQPIAVAQNRWKNNFNTGFESLGKNSRVKKHFAMHSVDVLLKITKYYTLPT